jgi:hypothetical protein
MLVTIVKQGQDLVAFKLHLNYGDMQHGTIVEGTFPQAKRAKGTLFLPS